jgi:LacI family transcriptional regulator
LQIDLQPTVTIEDVARAAGVSVTTVSHALSGKRPVSALSAARVGAAVERLGYRPNGVARSLRTRRSLTVALVIPDITNPFYPTLARGLQDVIGEDGYHVFICNTDADPGLERELLDDLAQRQVDGVVIVPFELTADDVAPRVDAGMAVVVLGRRIDHPNVDVVESDDAAGAAMAARHLVSLGHSRIGLIAGSRQVGELRATAFRHTLEELGLPMSDAFVAQGDWTREGGRAGAEKLLAGSPVTAVFAANDLMAIGAMDAALARGLSIPHDLSLVGYDDVDAASLLTPALTTVRNPAYDMGNTAGRLLMERLSGARADGRADVILDCALIERDSTRQRS